MSSREAERTVPLTAFGNRPCYDLIEDQRPELRFLHLYYTFAESMCSKFSNLLMEVAGSEHRIIEDLGSS